jgi:hypothetical protein
MIRKKLSLSAAVSGICLHSMPLNDEPFVFYISSDAYDTCLDQRELTQGVPFGGLINKFFQVALSLPKNFQTTFCMKI